MNQLRRWLAGLVVVPMILALTACTAKKPAPQTPPAGGTAPAAGKASLLKIGLSAEPPKLDPAINSGTAERAVVLNIYRGLFNYTKDGKLTNELADSYQVSPDNLTYTFKLRDAKFQNGDPVTATDVKFTLERLLDKKTGATFYQQLSVIDSVTALDDKTVQVKLKKPTAPFLDYLALPESAIVSKKWTEGHNGDLSGNPMGAGPYSFKEWQKGQKITLVRFKDYYEPTVPQTDTLEFDFYADGNTRVNAIKSGDMDVIEYVPWKDVPSIKADPNLQVLGGEGPFMGLIFNTTFKPFSDPRVRQAVAYAIDRQAIINTAFSGQGKPIWGMAVPSSSIAYDPKFDNYFKLDLDKAKQLLAEAGYPNGFKARLLATSQYDFHQNTAVVVKAELAKIGIDVTLDLPDWATRGQKNLKGDYDFLVVGTAGDYADPDYLTDYYQSSKQITLNGPVGFADPQIDQLLQQGRSTLDPAKRKAIYGQLQQRALDLSPIIFLMWRDQSYAAKKSVQGFAPLPGFLNFQSGIMLGQTAMTK